MASQRHLFAVPEDFGATVKDAMERAGRLLSSRARSEREVRDRLADASFTAEVIEEVVARLYDLDLLDDLAFATAWAEERAARKGTGPRALEAELAQRGIAPDVARQAVAAVLPEETGAAAQAAARLVRKVDGRPLSEQYQRLQQMLVRRGFSFEGAQAGARAVLPPEGWD